MYFEQFFVRFPEIAEKETRTITVLRNPEIPGDTYTLAELYCADPDCDCRRVFLSVLAKRADKMVAVIAFGWESEKFYKKWLGFDDPKMVKELKGPVLNLASPQSEFAPAILKLVTDVVLQDSKYVKRLARHYKLFKEAIAKEKKEKIQKKRFRKTPDALQTAVKAAPKAGRNEPCPCGSGKKYKKCCFNK